ncbi:helix-turn-helix domain-containing protein [Cupriavidus sp. 2TAF22]|uniref:helix-turn-helix domain-containing protein n=1 Tax=unclassified Cupriavidus TaxID=2640874 RepID=UPI003F93E44C
MTSGMRAAGDRAQDLLTTADAPVARLAPEVGVQTQAPFASVFKRLCGETPSRWRQRNARRQAARDQTVLLS